MIYYVEDDDSIRELVLYTLQQSGYECQGFIDGTTFFAALAGAPLPQLVILDIMLPGMDGIAILKKLRQNEKTASIPILMLSAKSTEYDKVIGLDSGADDYLAKPFGMMELVSRVKALLRRHGAPTSAKGDVLQAGLIEMDVPRHIVTIDGASITLTLKEFELLQYLLQNKGLVCTREKLLDAVWGYEFDGGTRTVDVHVQTLRQKLGIAGDSIKTIRGLGYQIGA